MPEQYVATDKRTGFEVQVTGEFPPHPDDRVRIARTTTLFTRLISTLLDSDEADRRSGFRAVETQLELADALIRQDMDDVRRLVKQTMENMGVTEGQLQDLARQLQDLGGMEDATAEQVARALGLDPEGPVPPFASPEKAASDHPEADHPPADEPPSSIDDTASPTESPTDQQTEWPPPPDTDGRDGEASDRASSDDASSDDASSDDAEIAPDEPSDDRPADDDGAAPSSAS
jgi:hypothetical protein